jgi:hypothetical protein
MSNEAKTLHHAQRLTEITLPLAVASLFRMNNYDVETDVHIHGAQVDLVATPKADPFARPLYIEATIEYVTNEKYAKDSTKFLLIKQKDPGARLICVSSAGFTANVKERAKESGVEAVTYDELFKRFEKFFPYIEQCMNSKELLSLREAYEEPNFCDELGQELAPHWLELWKNYRADSTKWLIILGEYGTGKTALTKYLQYKWIVNYHNDPAQPIPIRIELKNFSRQFDSKGLLHHFLDYNNLSHISVDFMIHLIRTGRAILLLDGYDEMAQFLNARERRSCLSALADLASDGAKGLLTSRPNYFTENEELNVFEALYKSVEQKEFFLARSDLRFVETERAIDNLVERYILNRYERSLQDLTPEQTRSLIKRSLGNDQKGQSIVLDILDRIFRQEASGTKQSLSGKPVIISYLLELVDELRSDDAEYDFDDLTEWQVYRLIVDRLMFRDLQRTPMNPKSRRNALQLLALKLSGRDKPVADEHTFFEIIDQEFSREIRSLASEEKRVRRLELFEDLRSSATLTRVTDRDGDGWTFSHNSLREFLVAEKLISGLEARQPGEVDLPISEAMRSFVASIEPERLERIWAILADIWPQRVNQFKLGPCGALFLKVRRAACNACMN